MVVPLLLILLFVRVVACSFWASSLTSIYSSSSFDVSVVPNSEPCDNNLIRSLNWAPQRHPVTVLLAEAPLGSNYLGTRPEQREDETGGFYKFRLLKPREGEMNLLSVHCVRLII